jgi:hypothetical protein
VSMPYRALKSGFPSRTSQKLALFSSELFTKVVHFSRCVIRRGFQCY